MMISPEHNEQDLEEIAAVLVRYKLGRLQKVTPARGGMTNENWFIRTSSGRYFLRRRHPVFSEASIDFELGLIEYLVASGFPTASLIHTRDDALRVEVFGHHWELYEYISGERFDANNLEQVRSSARLLARFHLMAASYNGDTSIAMRRVINFNRARRFIDIFEAELRSNRSYLGVLGVLLAPPLTGFFRSQAKLVLKGIRLLSRTPLELIHGDFQPSNVIFHGNTATALLDFGDAGLSYRVYDVAKAVLRFSTLRPDYSGQGDMDPLMDMDRAEAFIRTYQAELPLSSTEIKAIPALLRGAYLYDAGFFLWKQDNPLQKAFWLLNAWQFSRWIDRYAEEIMEVFYTV